MSCYQEQFGSKNSTGYKPTNSKEIKLGTHSANISIRQEELPPNSVVLPLTTQQSLFASTHRELMPRSALKLSLTAGDRIRIPKPQITKRLLVEPQHHDPALREQQMFSPPPISGSQMGSELN